MHAPEASLGPMIGDDHKTPACDEAPLDVRVDECMRDEDASPEGVGA